MDDEQKFHDLISLRRALDARLRRLEQDLREMTGNIHAQVEQRKALARSLELSRRLLDMYEQVRSSPHWEKVASETAGGESAREAPADEASVPPPVGTEGCEGEFLRFDQNSRGYIICRKRVSEGLTTGCPASMLLSFCHDAGATLLTIDLIEEQTPYGPTYKSTDIKAFVPGNWIKDFLELSEQVSALKKELEIRKKYDPVEIDKLKRLFGI
ncbi:MAG: hypothetical protein EPO61_04440 [Nitrospirae bacterium]|nr:MAG: hypothetical protein EPO61_04440 [Nitrospirota bacterium]